MKNRVLRNPKRLGPKYRPKPVEKKTRVSRGMSRWESPGQPKRGARQSITCSLYELSQTMKGWPGRVDHGTGDGVKASTRTQDNASTPGRNKRRREGQSLAGRSGLGHSRLHEDRGGNVGRARKTRKRGITNWLLIRQSICKGGGANTWGETGKRVWDLHHRYGRDRGPDKECTGAGCWRH